MWGLEHNKMQRQNQQRAINGCATVAILMCVVGVTANFDQQLA